MSTQHVRHRRGLTLLEVLIATAMLAMLAAACLPVITRAMLLLRETRSSTAEHAALIELGVAADVVVANAESFGADVRNEPLHKIDVVQVTWPLRDGVDGAEAPNRRFAPIVIRRLPSVDSAANHVWLSFTCDGVTVHRWLGIPIEDLPRDHETGTGAKRDTR